MIDCIMLLATWMSMMTGIPLWAMFEILLNDLGQFAWIWWILGSR